jgi:hypothetical protein
MNKKEFMQASWIHIQTRLPKDDPLEFVLCYNSKTGYMSVAFSWVAREIALIMLSPREESPEPGVVVKRDIDYELSWDRQFNYWMPLYPPEGKQTWAEYHSKTKKGRRS